MPADNGLIGMNVHRDGSGQSVEGLGRRRQQHRSLDVGASSAPWTSRLGAVDQCFVE